MFSRLSPPRMLLLSFGGLILLGTVLLALPWSGAGNQSVGVLSALFTSTSAVCVTGLAVVDTASAWSGFGQAVILGLIQLGGLGILTFSTILIMMLGRKLSLSHHTVLMGGVRPLRQGDVWLVLRRILIYTLGFEALGAVLLWLCWRDELGGEALGHAVFHSVSAFCNAGFSTFSDSLVRWRGDVAVNLVVMGLIVTGGLGFVVFLDLENRLRFGRRVTLHTRLVLGTTLILIVVGAAAFYFCETSNSLASMSTGEGVLASFFASVTARTAGFNTVDYGHITSAGLVLTLMLMFIGGSPGSTAGGVKTTAIAVLFGQARSALRGGTRVELFGRSVAPVSVRQTHALVLLAGLTISIAPFVLEFTEYQAAPFAESAVRYLELWFEATSAFATTGLSTGITPTLSPPGKLFLIVLMYVGRVGLLTVALAIANPRHRRFHFAEENVLVG